MTFLQSLVCSSYFTSFELGELLHVFSYQVCTKLLFAFRVHAEKPIFKVVFASANNICCAVSSVVQNRNKHC